MCQDSGMAMYVRDNETHELRGPCLAMLEADKLIESWTAELAISAKAAAWRFAEVVAPCPCGGKARRPTHDIDKLRQVLPRPDIRQFADLGWTSFEQVLDEGKCQAFKIAEHFKTADELQGKCGAVFYGPVGVGKSGLMYLIYKHKEQQGGIWLDYNHLMNFIQSTYDKRTAPTDTAQIMQAISTVPYLFLDDMGDIAATNPKTGVLLPVSNDRRNKTYDIIRARHEKELTTFITTNLDRPQFECQFGDRIADRLEQLCGWQPVGGANLRKAALKLVNLAEWER